MSQQIYSKMSLEEIEHLYKSYYRQLYLYALTFLEDEEGAKDVLNDAFEKVFTDTQTADYRADTILGFLYRIIRNLCLDILRHRRVHERFLQMKMATEGVEDTSTFDVMEFENRINKVREAVNELPEPEQSILKCCYFKKLTYKQTAAELQVTVNVVHKRMVNAFRILREMLKKA